MTPGATIRTSHWVWLALPAALASHAAIFLPLLPDAAGKGGPDYGYFVPQLLAGYFWYVQNGLSSLPWFTPAFCAGMPFYPNMQAMYFSVPQLLTFALGPTLAVRLTFLLFAGAGLAGMYALLRIRFRTSQWAAAAGAILFLFNGFFAFRLLAGHLTFHAFMLAPLVAYAVLHDREESATWRNYLNLRVVIAAFLIGYMIQSGMVHAFPATMAAIAVFMLVHALMFDSSLPRSFLRLFVACALALLLNAAKLTAAIAFMQQFPRTMLPMMGFDSIGHVLVTAFKALFFVPSLAEQAAWLRNNEWYPGQHVVLPFHELAYSVTFVPMVVLLAALPWIVKSLRAEAGAGDLRGFAVKGLLVAAVLAILSLPILLNWYAPEWSAFLKSIPVIRNSSTLTRWFCLYVLVAVLVTSLVLDRLTAWKALAPVAALATLVIAIGTDAVLARAYTRSDYFTEKVYDFTKLEQVYRDVRATGQVPAIERVDWAKVSRETPWSTQRHRNETMATGGSQAMCYEPMFGHRLEEYPFGALREGCVFKAGADLLNIKNPTCMLFPEANGCRPGDQFTREQADRAWRFVNYRPFPFSMPWYQHAANVLNLGALVLLLGALAILAIRERPSRGVGQPELVPPRG